MFNLIYLIQSINLTHIWLTFHKRYHQLNYWTFGNASFYRHPPSVFVFHILFWSIHYHQNQFAFLFLRTPFTFCFCCAINATGIGEFVKTENYKGKPIISTWMTSLFCFERELDNRFNDALARQNSPVKKKNGSAVIVWPKRSKNKDKTHRSSPRPKSYNNKIILRNLCFIVTTQFVNQFFSITHRVK